MDTAPFVAINWISSEAGTPTTSFHSVMVGQTPQPTCKPFALRAILKRAESMAYPFQTFTPATDRVGIPSAIRTIVDRYKAGERTTAIVAPPRYGKSDIIRLAALELIETGCTPCALALAPFEQIAKQLAAADKLSNMSNRYLIPGPARLPEAYNAKRLTSFTDRFHEDNDLIHLFTATIGLATSQAETLLDWAGRCKDLNTRPIVFIDEAQYLSNGNTWGSLSWRLQDLGAHIVLLTGTPYRNDSYEIPGFRVETNDYKQVSRVTRKKIDQEKDLKEYWEGSGWSQRLIPDDEVTFREAWEKKALAHIQAEFIRPDAYLEGDSVPFSNLSMEDQQRSLRKASTNPKVMEAVIKKCLEDLKERRRTHPDSAALFVTVSDREASDTEDDAGANWHARQVQRIINKIDPTLTVSIATQAIDNESSKANKAQRLIDRFIGYVDKYGNYHKPEGDILIVKSMGTVGLDSPRLKTIGFLGTFRTFAAWIQAVLRGATTWDTVSYMTLVLLEDKKNLRNWNHLIRDAGGVYQRVEEVEKVNEEVVDKTDPSEKTIIDITGGKHVLTEDSDLASPVDMEMHHQIRRIYDMHPRLKAGVQDKVIEEMLKAGTMVVPDEMPIAQKGIPVHDVGKEIAYAAEELEILTKRYATLVCPMSEDPRGWQAAKREISTAAKAYGGYTRQPRHENDPAKILAAVAFVQEQIDQRERRT